MAERSKGQAFNEGAQDATTRAVNPLQDNNKLCYLFSHGTEPGNRATGEKGRRQDKEYDWEVR